MYKVQDAEDKEVIYNTDAKGIVLDDNGVISTMSNQIYAKAVSATEKEFGAITNKGIDFKGGGLVLMMISIHNHMLMLHKLSCKNKGQLS